MLLSGLRGCRLPLVPWHAYDVVAVELKWQRHWQDEGTYQVDNDDPREKFYALCMYPYPPPGPGALRAMSGTTPSVT